MGFLDRIFIGKSVELGVIQERGRFPSSKPKTTVLIAEKRGRFHFVVKHSAWFLLAGYVYYYEYSPEEALKLRDALSRFEEVLAHHQGKEEGNN